MKRQVFWPVLAFVALVGVAHAHSHLQKSVPENGSVVRSAPQSLVLEFSEATRITGLTLQKGTEEARKIAHLPPEPASHMSIPLPALTPGTYIVTWRGVSQDSHVRSGTIRFTLSAAGTKQTQAPQH